MLFTDTDQPFYAQADLVEVGPLTLRRPHRHRRRRIRWQATRRPRGPHPPFTGGHPQRSMQLADAAWTPGTTASSPLPCGRRRSTSADVPPPTATRRASRACNRRPGRDATRSIERGAVRPPRGRCCRSRARRRRTPAPGCSSAARSSNPTVASRSSTRSTPTGSATASRSDPDVTTADRHSAVAGSSGAGRNIPMPLAAPARTRRRSNQRTSRRGGATCIRDGSLRCW